MKPSRVSSLRSTLKKPLLCLPKQVLSLQKLSFLGAASSSLTNWISPPVALTMGMLLALSIENPFPYTSKQVAKTLLQACVVLLGFGMDLAVVFKAGRSGALFAAGSIALTFLLGHLLGEWLKIPQKASILISAGTAICGGSAIAALSSVIVAAESEISIAMGTVFLLNAAALYLFAPLGHMLHLTPTQFGTWAGVAIHDISSVVGTASSFGMGTLDIATAVKLSRALWIVPVSLLAALMFQSLSPANGQRRLNQIQVPWFIGLFLLASVVRTLVPSISFWSPILTQLSELGMKLTLFLIGTGLSMRALGAVGWKAVMQGVILWLFISLSSLCIILQIMH